MSKGRLSFPFSFLTQPTKAIAARPLSRLVLQPVNPVASPTRLARISSSATTRAPETSNQRYGTANEPPPHLGGGGPKTGPPQTVPPVKLQQDSSTTPERQPQSQPQRVEPAQLQAEVQQATQESNVQTTKITEAQQITKDATSASDQQQKESEPHRRETTLDGPDDFAFPTTESALHTILNMESPMSNKSSAEKPPHLQTPQYVHHFDTFTIVKDLQEGGFSEDEAIIMMKAVRAALADNMDLAKDGILSKSSAEMQAYLFRSACSELRSEIKNNRSSLTERMRTERNQLQHEVDVLGQRITADTKWLENEMKGMRDDHNLALKTERRNIENKVQEINYAITTRLGSELRTDVEGLRWIMVRRTAMALAIVAAGALIVLRIANKAEQRQDSMAAPGSLAGDHAISPDGQATLFHRAGAGGEDPELVSLG